VVVELSAVVISLFVIERATGPPLTLAVLPTPVPVLTRLDIAAEVAILPLAPLLATIGFSRLDQE